MNVCIIGLGVVGKGVYDILKNDIPKVNVKYVLELDETKTKGIDCVANSFEEVINDSEVDTVIELIGGINKAYYFVKESLKAKKNVVTANKALISKYFKELHDLASANEVVLAYEASVGGAINILDPLKTISKINKIHKIEGIINGSTNFILSKIFLDDYTLNQALLEANELGYIETNSTDDLDGLDLMRKINILSMISYQQYINEDDISVVPLSSLTTEFIEYIKNHNLIIKYLATSKRINNRIIIHLEPVVFDSNSIYSKINYEDNIISIFGEYHQKQSFIGQGAGRYPTASAVVYDLLKINDNCNNTYNYKNNLIIDNNYCKYYFLVQAGDRIFKSDLLSIKEVLSDKSIKCLARISEALYEKI